MGQSLKSLQRKSSRHIHCLCDSQNVSEKASTMASQVPTDSMIKERAEVHAVTAEPEDKTTVLSEVRTVEAGDTDSDGVVMTIDQIRASKEGRFAYYKTKDFYIVLVLGYVKLPASRNVLTSLRQVLALCLTATNTFSTLLVIQGTSIPAFQSLFNYILLTLIYTTYTIYKYGFRGWLKFLYNRGWKCTCKPTAVAIKHLGLQIEIRACH